MIHKSRSGWKWLGYAGHFVGGRSCAYHLATVIRDKVLVSTVGDYTPDLTKPAQPLGSEPEMLYETFCFEVKGYDKFTNPVKGKVLDTMRYTTSLEAEAGHYVFCEKYNKLTRA